VRAYQLYLIGEKRSWSHVNQTVCALRFFYGITLGRRDAIERIVAAREPQRLPVVLSTDEIVRFLEAVPGLRNRAALTTAYGAGLRAGEVARLAEQDASGATATRSLDHSAARPFEDPDTPKPKPTLRLTPRVERRLRIGPQRVRTPADARLAPTVARRPRPT